MFFLDAFQAPRKVCIRQASGKAIIVHAAMVKLDQVIEWATKVMEETYESGIASLDEVKKHEYRLMYPPIQPDIFEMRRRVETPEGIKQILTFSLVDAPTFEATPFSSGKGATEFKEGKALDPISEGDVEAILGRNPTFALLVLCRSVSGLHQESTNPSPEKKGDGSDPLAGTESSEFNPSPKTGEKTSPPSTPPTPTSTLAT